MGREQSGQRGAQRIDVAAVLSEQMGASSGKSGCCSKAGAGGFEVPLMGPGSRGGGGVCHRWQSCLVAVLRRALWRHWEGESQRGLCLTVKHAVW